MSASDDATRVLALDEIYRGEAPFVWRTLCRLGVREGDASDATQEVFVVVHRRLRDFDPSRPLRPWLFGICRRVAAKMRRLPHHQHERSVAEPPALVIAPAQHQAIERREASERLQALLDELPEAQREVFLLFELEQLPMTEVAEAVDCPLQTAYSRLYAARKEMADGLTRTRARARREEGE